MRGLGKTASNTGRANSNMQVVTYMWAAGTKTSKKAMALKTGSMAPSTKAITRVVSSTAKATTPGQMDHYTVATGLKMK